MIRQAIHRLLLCANVLIIAGLLISGYSGIINPADHPYLSLIGFSFPAFLLGNILFIFVWLLVGWKYIPVPIVGFILAYSPVHTYMPLNFSASDHSEDSITGSDGIKVLSYNILRYNAEEAPENEPNAILDYMVNSDADIICIQELSYSVAGQDSLMALLNQKYEYTDSVHSDGKDKGDDVIGIYTRYPIISKAHIPIVTKGNALGVFVLNMDGDTVHVINAHLETVGMSTEQKAQFQELVHGNRKGDDFKSDSKMVIHKLAQSAAIRAPQADAINDYISQHQGERIIFCGDINDHPLSYVHNTIAQQLNDCYAAAGWMMGFSFQYHSMYVRIDNIMCSEHFEPTLCTVDKSVKLSDHFPVYCILKQKNKEE